jgi:plastocyanin
MNNAGEQAHEFEVLDPDGEPIGEVAATNPGESGGATMTFTAPGVYTYQCILVDPDTGKPHTELGMIGTFDVADG